MEMGTGGIAAGAGESDALTLLHPVAGADQDFAAMAVDRGKIRPVVQRHAPAIAVAEPARGGDSARGGGRHRRA